MICSDCDKQFSKKSNLTRHQKLNNCLSKCPHCNSMCRRAVHLLNCPTLLNHRIKELENQNANLLIENTQLNAEITPMRIRNTQLEMDNERYIGQITKLQDDMHKKLTELSKEMKKANKKKQQQQYVITNNTNHNNIRIENLTILNPSDFSKFSESLTMEHIKRGAIGYAEFATTFPLHNKIICTDLPRKKIKYKTSKNEVKSDVHMRSITKDLFQSINERNKNLILDYAKNTIDVIKNTEEKMMAYEKFMKYISLIRDGAQGIDHSLYPDFVREVCMMSI